MATPTTTCVTDQIVTLATRAGLHPHWGEPYKGTRLLYLDTGDRDGVFGSVTVGCRSGRVLRGELIFGNEGRKRRLTGAVQVRAALKALLPDDRPRMYPTIKSTDVLVATRYPAANAALALSDRLWWATHHYDAAVETYEKSLERSSEVRQRHCGSAVARTWDALKPLNAEYKALLAGLPADLAAKVDGVALRDRVAEYAHAREISEKEKSSR